MCAIANTSDELTPVRSAPRWRWVDSAKGIAILCVVTVHAVNGLKRSGILASGTRWDFCSDWLYTFQVPVFFFVAGLFAGRSWERLGSRKFLWTKLGALAYPFIVWRTLQILIMVAAGGATNHQASLWTLLTFPWEPFMQFWFLYVLMMVFVVYTLLKIAHCSDRVILAIAVAMLFLPNTGWPPYNSLCASMAYFAGGLVLHDRINALERVRPLWLLAAAALCVVGGMLLVGQGMLYETPLVPLPAMLGIAAVILVSFVGVRFACWEPICFLGRYSLEIYVAHTTFAAGARIVLSKFLHVESLPVHVCVGIAVSILGPLVLALLQQRPVGHWIPLFRPRFAATS